MQKCSFPVHSLLLTLSLTVEYLGMATGTNLINDLHPLKVAMFHCLVPIIKLFGMSHGNDMRAKRYVDAVYDFETQELYQTGIFYGSMEGFKIGPMGNQIEFFDALGNETFQENAYEAIHSFSSEHKMPPFE